VKAAFSIACEPVTIDAAFVTMYTSSVIARAKAALQGSETEQRIAVLLYDDSIQVISSFELNQLASLTYHESNILTSSRHDMVEILLDHLEQITTQPINYSILSVQKALAVTKHLLLHGAEKIIPLITQQLGRLIDTLRQYNTVLAAQQQSTAWLIRIKGGGVDTAGPVRELAEQIMNLLYSSQQLQFERCTHADPNSLVPIGDRSQVAFITDDVRYAQLKLRMQQERSIQTKSNLVKASDGFGSGYMSTNGRNVVGAAHGIEEMLKAKAKEEQRFTDESSKKNTVREHHTSAADISFSDYIAPDIYNNSNANVTPHQQQSNEPDLLSLGHHYNATIPSTTAISTQQPAVVDLLDLGGNTNIGNCSTDLFTQTITSNQNVEQQQQQYHYHPQQQQPISIQQNHGIISDIIHEPISNQHHNLQGTTILNNDARGIISDVIHEPISNQHHNLQGTTIQNNDARFYQPQPQSNVTTINTNHINSNNATQQGITTMVSPNVDRFAALDALTTGSSTNGTMIGNCTNNVMLSGTATKSSAFSDLIGPFSTSKYTATTPYRNSTLTDLNQLQFSITNNGTTTNPSMMMMAGQYNNTAVVTSTISTSSIQVSQLPTISNDDTDNCADGFVMGGSTGTGLIPTGHAPSSAPPPPPPSFYGL
jgi:hypothetical protein